MVLLEDHPKLGKKGSLVRVKRKENLVLFFNLSAGYARLFLYPGKVAKYATDLNIVKYSLPYTNLHLRSTITNKDQ